MRHHLLKTNPSESLVLQVYILFTKGYKQNDIFSFTNTLSFWLCVSIL